jgi:hypothetical protein
MTGPGFIIDPAVISPASAAPVTGTGARETAAITAGDAGFIGMLMALFPGSQAGMSPPEPASAETLEPGAPGSGLPDSRTGEAAEEGADKPSASNVIQGNDLPREVDRLQDGIRAGAGSLFRAWPVNSSISPWNLPLGGRVGPLHPAAGEVFPQGPAAGTDAEDQAGGTDLAQATGDPGRAVIAGRTSAAPDEAGFLYAALQKPGISFFSNAEGEIPEDAGGRYLPWAAAGRPVNSTAGLESFIGHGSGVQEDVAAALRSVFGLPRHAPAGTLTGEVRDLLQDAAGSRPDVIDQSLSGDDKADQGFIARVPVAGMRPQTPTGLAAAPAGALRDTGLSAGAGKDADPAPVLRALSEAKVKPVLCKEDREEAFTFNLPEDAGPGEGKSAGASHAWARTMVSRVHEEVLEAKTAGRTSVRIDVTTETGETVHIRLAVRSNSVSGRIGVMNAETRDLLAMHMPELSHRLQAENLVPGRLDVYLLNGEGGDGRRGDRRRPRRDRGGPEESQSGPDRVTVPSKQVSFEQWA